MLGPHRVMCGDSTSQAHVGRLMDADRAEILWTDPPYGVEYVGGTGLTIQNDDAEGLPALLRDAFARASEVLTPGAAIYVAHPEAELGIVFGVAFLAAGWRLHQSLVWVKDSMVLGHSDYHYRHEAVMFGSAPGRSKRGKKHEGIFYGYAPGGGRRGRGGEGWHGNNSQTTVLEIPRPKRSLEHPTMKPVELVARCLLNSSRPGDIVLDLFGGSGSTLIAAHTQLRVARLMELDPVYVDVICRRWQEFTGELPVLEATGEPHDFTAEGS